MSESSPTNDKITTDSNENHRDLRDMDSVRLESNQSVRLESNQNLTINDAQWTRSETSSPSKQLPTKFRKAERARSRQDMTQVIQSSDRNRERRSPYPNETPGPERQTYSTIKNILTTTNQDSSQGKNDSSNNEAPQAQELPLNLTTSTLTTSVALTSGNTLPTYTQLRPSVILHAAHSALGMDTNSNGSLNLNLPTSAVYPQSPTTQSPAPVYPPRTAHSPTMNQLVSRREIMTAVDDSSSVDEHFRRSLGKNYPGYSDATTVASPPRPTTPPSRGESEHDSVDGSVDDHFARSLGQTKWNEIKSKSGTSSPGSQGPVGASTVDDHFAKALGEQWNTIKAQRQNGSPQLTAPS